MIGRLGGDRAQRVQRVGQEVPQGSALDRLCGIALREIAAVIGRRLGVPVASVPAEDAERHLGHLSMFVGLDNPTSSRITRVTLGWTPTRPGLISDLDEEHNLAAEANTMSAG